MTAIGLAAAVAITWGASDFVAGLASRRFHLLAVLLYSQGFAYIIILIAASGMGGTPSTTSGGIASALAGVAWFVGIVFFYRALAIGAMGVVAPIGATGVLIPVIYGLLRGEPFGLLHVLGGPLCFAGTILASRVAGARAVTAPATPVTPRRRWPTGGLRNPVVLAALSAAASGTQMVLVAHATDSESTISILLVQRTMVIASVVAAIALVRPKLTATPRFVAACVGAGALDIAGGAAFVAANQRAAVAVVAILVALFPLVTAGLARVVISERLSRAQHIGALMALMGAALIAAGSGG